MSDGDEAIFERWITQRDPKAFRTIVARYSAMVYATCLRVLGNATEAEDVTQECFEALAQVKRSPGSYLGPWLHRVATGLALNRIRSAKRRKSREARFASELKSDARVEWNDIYEYVDEAITELPDKLRVPVVAHFLENQSYEAIAQATGISPRTVSYRVGKGIELIGKSLRRRGITIALSGLAATMAARLAEAAQVPASVTATLGKLALAGIGSSGATAGASVGAIAGRRLLTIGGITIMTKKVLVGTGLLVLLVVSAYSLRDRSGQTVAEKQSGLALQTARAPSAEPAKGRDTESPVSDTDGEAPGLTTGEEPITPESGPLEKEPIPAGTGDEPERPQGADEEPQSSASVSGYVMDEQAYPFPGASIYLEVVADGLGYDILAVYAARTEADGAYEITGIHSFGDALIYASAPGHQMQKRMDLDVFAGAVLENVNFTLRRGRFFVAGHVISRTDDPIPSACVNLRHYGYTENDLALAVEQGSHPLGSATGAANFAFAVTDEEGHFEIAVPREGLCDFTVSKEGYGPGYFPKVPTGTDNALFVLRAEGAISGNVALPEGTPVEGARVRVEGVVWPGGVTPTRVALQQIGLGGKVTYTDAQGIYYVDGLGGDCHYTVRADKGTLTAPAKEDVRVQPGETTRNVDFVLRAGARVYGRVTDATSGLPVFPLLVWAGWVQDNADSRQTIVGQASTGVDGRYDMHLKIGANRHLQVGAAYTHPAGTLEAIGGSQPVAVELEPGAEVQVDFTVDAPITIPIRVVDENGVPLERIGIALNNPSLNRELGFPESATTWSGGSLVTDTDGRYVWSGLTPRQTYVVRAMDLMLSGSEALLGESGPIMGEPGETVAEVVVVCVTKGGIEGTVIDSNGDPCADLPITVMGIKPDGLQVDPVKTVTDANGRFVVLRALPEGIYAEIRMSSENRGVLEEAYAENVKIVSDSVVDLGVGVLAAPENVPTE